ncbi:bestrophin-2-like isoform X2 [Eriocheir sinensis]|uniref:bestrophin-2-like isoform X2 n=1 Tax=Eriocheir sinensis TaxID=95602 RepID=UPI0021C9EA3C|nr:bestrophin-2-like isoform X2 [Eriocheir sinensis]
MTVQYIHRVASGSALMSFYLLKRWRGSVYKVVWKDLIVYLVLYYTISFVYRFALWEEGRRNFERLVIHCSRTQSVLPVSFVLGFYVSLVVGRWWETYRSLPWPDNTAILLATHLAGQGVGREERRAVLRYVVLTITLTLATISPEVLAVYPSFEVMVKKGFLTEEEARLLDKHKEESEQQVAWVPIVWACQIVQRARQAGRIATNLGQKALTDEMLNLRVSCGRLLGFNSHNIPLVYVQVVTLAVYSFFLISVIGGQFIDTTKGYETHTIDLYVPFFAILQLVFYLGWLKVAEALINPFGDDDHDFEFLSMIERHRKMVEMLGDSAANDLPFLDPLSKEDADSSAPTMHTSVPIVAPTVCPVICKMIETQPASAGGRIVQETTPLITTSKAEPPLLPNIRHISPYS